MPWLDAAWADAGWYEDGALPFDPSDRGLLLADGVFDTALVLGGAMIWRERHIRRLLAHADALGIVVPRERIERAIDAVLDRHHEGSIRLTVTRGCGPRGLAPPSIAAVPTVLATPAPLRGSVLFARSSLITAAARRNETAATSRLKSLGYLDAVLAARDARAAGADDALFLNTRGEVACTGSGNLFALFGSDLVTPPREAGVLDGVVRAVLLEEGRVAGISIGEARLMPVDLTKADLLFATNSLRLLSPVRMLDATAVRVDHHHLVLIETLARRVEAESGIDPRTLAAG